jgi:hypothetical protein
MSGKSTVYTYISNKSFKSPRDSIRNSQEVIDISQNQVIVSGKQVNNQMVIRGNRD